MTVKCELFFFLVGKVGYAIPLMLKGICLFSKYKPKIEKLENTKQCEFSYAPHKTWEKVTFC